MFVFNCNYAPGRKISEIASTEPMTRRDAVAHFEERVRFMRGNGFRIRMNSPMAGTVRRAEIWNKHSGECEAIYWVESELVAVLGDALKETA